jgi:hypothetical protein
MWYYFTTIFELFFMKLNISLLRYVFFVKKISGENPF